MRKNDSNSFTFGFDYIVPLDMKGCIWHEVAYTPFHIQGDDISFLIWVR